MDTQKENLSYLLRVDYNTVSSSRGEYPKCQKNKEIQPARIQVIK